MIESFLRPNAASPDVEVSRLRKSWCAFRDRLINFCGTCSGRPRGAVETWRAVLKSVRRAEKAISVRSVGARSEPLPSGAVFAIGARADEASIFLTCPTQTGRFSFRLRTGPMRFSPSAYAITSKLSEKASAASASASILPAVEARLSFVLSR